MLNMFFYHDDIDTIVIGDKIIYEIFNKEGIQIDKVISETPKRFKTLNGIEFSKSNNTIIGDGKQIRLLTKQIEENLEFYKIALQLKRFDFEKIPIQQLHEIKLIIDRYK